MRNQLYWIVLGCLFLVACGGVEPVLENDLPDLAVTAEVELVAEPTTAVLAEVLSPEEREALYFAAILADDVSAASEQLAAGVDIALERENGFDGLQTALARGNADMVMMLLEAGAPFDQDMFNEAMLYLGGSVDAAELFIELGADPGVAESGGPQHSPLMHAAEGNHVELGRYLLEQGVDIDQEDRYGDPALNVAAYHGHLPFVEMLVEAGAALDMTGYGNRTALGHAIARGNDDVVDFLTAVGASES